MALDLIACPDCGGCGYVGDENCEGCCAQGYVPVEVDDTWGKPCVQCGKPVTEFVPEDRDAYCFACYFGD